MTKVSRESGARCFYELWQTLDQDQARIDHFLKMYAYKIHLIDEPKPSSVRQLCKPGIFNWLESLMNEQPKKTKVDTGW